MLVRISDAFPKKQKEPGSKEQKNKKFTLSAVEGNKKNKRTKRTRAAQTKSSSLIPQLATRNS